MIGNNIHYNKNFYITSDINTENCKTNALSYCSYN